MQKNRQQTSFPVLPAIFVGIVIWAALISAGVFYRSGGNLAKTSIVIAVATVFLGGWLFILKRRS